MKQFTLIILFFAIIHPVVKSKDLKGEEIMLHYLVREPKIKQDHPPVILLLHGVGSNEKDLFSFADQLPDKFLVISVRAPYKISEGSYAWYSVDFATGKPVYNKEEAEKSRNTLIHFIDQLKERYPFNEQQVYLCGFSQGAIMSYSVGLTRPDKIKGIAIMSGRLLEEVKPLILSNEKLKQLNIFISHGTNDNVLTVQYARESNAYLKQLGINASYKEYPEGHTISNEMFIDLKKWLNVEIK